MNQARILHVRHTIRRFRRGLCLALCLFSLFSIGARAEDGTETALLAGGCFWGMEELLRTLPGVVDTEVGYSGGKLDQPTYRLVSQGSSGHAETVKVTFDSSKITYEEIVRFFFRIHDPTTLNRQGNDRGTQYRSVIFYLNDNQRRAAESVKESVERAKKWKDPIVTEITPAGEFFPAEGYHQDYLQKNPDGYTCHYIRE